MSEGATTTGRALAASRVRAASRIAVVTHTRPDGDAIGSVLALTRALPAVGPAVEAFLMGPIEPPLLHLLPPTPWRRVEEEPPGDRFDLVIVVDTGAWSQLEPLEPWLRARHDDILVLDHHPHGDADLASVRVVDPTAAATTVLVLALLDELGLAPTEGGPGSVAEALFVGLATDTGWFRYPNAGARAFATAARLLELGVDKGRLYEVIEEGYAPARLALEARALASIEYLRDGAVAIQSIGPDDFEATGATIEDLTGLVNRPMIVDGVRVAILLAEAEPGVTKMSFRARPHENDDDLARVDTLASRFGGGGHAFAAGARMDAPLGEARRALEAALAPSSAPRA